jgi:trimeric autotransporter adhesin
MHRLIAPIVNRLIAPIVNGPQTASGAASRCARSVVLCLIAVVMLFAQGTAGQGQTAAGRAASAPRDVEGTLEVHYEDSTDGARLTHFLNTGTERIPLRFEKNPPRHLLTGSHVRAHGTMSEGVLALTSGDGPTSDLTTLALASPNTFGVQSTLVILFNFLDVTTQPYTTATAQSITFTDVNNFDLENSFNQTSLTGTVTGWYTIAAVSTTCNYSNWALLADQAATNAGVNVAAYPRRVYGFPQTSACPWFGLGTVGGGTVANPSRAWINTTYSLQVVAHEMGHNFGLYHSHSNTCDSTGCTQAEYGDDHDVMGNYTTAHFNAYQKERLGWLNSGTSPPIQTVTTVGPYTLEAYETPWGGLPKALEIFQSASAGENTYLYAEVRTPYGIDSTLAPGVLIHAGNDTDGNQSFLQDVLPTTTTTDFILDPGQSVTFAGDSSPITFTTLSADATGAVVAVTPSPAPCTYSLGAVGQSMVSGGGGGGVTLTTTSDCYWNATSNAGWITLDAGSTSGVGSANISFTVAANVSSSPRTGTVTIIGQTYTVTQAGMGCSYTVTPASAAFNYGGGSGAVTVSTSAGCTWTAVSNASWITVTTGATGSGNGSVTYSVASRSQSQGPRNKTITVAGHAVTVTESAISDTSLSSAAAGGTYGGTTSLSATLTANGSPLGGETVNFSLNGAAVGTAVTNASGVATLSNVSLGSVAAGSYPTGVGASMAGDSTFNPSSATSQLTIARKTVTAAVTASNKTYDGTTSATLASCTLTGVVGSDVVSCGAGPPTFDTASVGVGKTVTVSGMTLIGAAAPDYTLASPTATTTANITAATVTATVTASDKVYDGTTNATLTNCTLTGVVSGDTVTCAGTATFDTAAVGTGKTVTVNGLTLGGVAGGNYALSSPTATTTATIRPATTAATVTAANKPYDGTTSATLSSCALSGLIAGDTVTCTGTATFTSATPGAAKTVTVNGLTLGGPDAGKYTLASTTATTTATITAATVTATVAAATKTYDGTTSATVTSCALTGVVGSDAVSCSAGSATFDTASVGTGKLVTATGLTLGGPAASNYALASPTSTTTAAITARTLTAAVTASNKAYDGTTSATLSDCALTGAVSGDTVTCTGAAAFDTATVGTGKTVTVAGLTLGGAVAGDYTLSSTTAITTASIAPATVTPTLSAANKTYDGSTTATVTGCALTGVVGSDAVSCSAGAATFNTASVGTAKAVTVTGITLTGAAAASYTLSSSTASTTATINAAPVTATVSAASKTYDGTATATVTGCTLTGVVSGDVVSCSAGAATFNTSSVGTAKAVTATGLSLAGASAANYSLASTTAVTTATINAATVTATVTAANKTFDGTTTATVTSCTLTGVVGSDAVSCSPGAATFDTPNVGIGKTVTVTGLTLIGAAAGNYTLASTTATTLASITAAVDTTPPTAPTGLTATAVGATQINLTWTAATDNVGVTGYFVERCAGPGCTTFVQVLTPSGTSVSDVGLAAGTAYSYRVRATDAAGNLGAYSGTASATTTAAAAISFVQLKAATPDSAQTTVSVTYPAAQTAGNLNVVAIGWGDTVRTVVSVTDSRNNVYTPAVGRTISSGGGLSQTIYYAKNIAAAPAGGNTVTVTFSGAAAFPDVRVVEYSGADPSAPVDATATGVGSGSTSSATVTTTAATDLIFGADVVATMTTAAGPGFTSRIITADGNLVEDRMVTAAGSYTATAALSAGAWVTQLVAFRAAGSH